MSHSLEHSGYTFLYNSDMSGDVTIVNPGVTAVRHLGSEIRVPAAALLAFVAEHVRRTRISDLESASDLDVLGIGDPNV